VDAEGDVGSCARPTYNKERAYCIVSCHHHEDHASVPVDKFSSFVDAVVEKRLCKAAILACQSDVSVGLQNFHATPAHNHSITFQTNIATTAWRQSVADVMLPAPDESRHSPSARPNGW
jgi:hypothetical protein